VNAAGEVSNKAYIFDRETGSITAELPDLPEGRAMHACAVQSEITDVDEKKYKVVFVAGGSTIIASPYNPSNKLFIYGFRHANWTEGPDLTDNVTATR